ncbi:MAG: cation:proton antiporter [Bacteroidales bacterium]|nr:cation:proton antiporter [Bacteroidales bacterium]MBR6161690.1 cation:proton antiporter [Bacteroidales bacterium]
MSENLRLVSDLALILISAGIVTVIFKLLKQPIVLGYIVAGFLVGPHLHIFPTVTDIADVEVWSEIGIIFLLFALGLEFSFKKLFSVGSKAFVTALLEIVSMIAVGMLLGFLMDWGVMESIFLGGMLAMSSTTIIIKAFDDMKLKNEPFVDLTLVVLIIQDIVAVVMMVLLSTAAASKQAAGKEMLESILKLLFFLILWFVVGIYLIPTLFRKAKKYINDETLLIISIGLCFGMVIIANNVGFSSALGAFVIGSILSETVESERIVKLTSSIKDLFGAIFFVSVGMMVDPAVLGQYWKLVLSLVVITLVFKAIISSAAAMLAGASLEDSLKTGFTLSQIGEFAFIVASVGVTLKVLPSHIYPVIIAASVITTFTTPYWIKAATPCYKWLNGKLSPAQKARLDEYCLLGRKSGDKNWGSIITYSLPRVLIFTVLSMALLFVLFDHLFPFIRQFEVVKTLPRWLFNSFCAITTILLLLPFLYGIVYNNVKTRQLYSEMSKKNKSNIIVITVWTLIRFLIAGFFVFTVLVKFFKYTKWVILLVTLAVIIFMMFSSRTLKRFTLMESSFMKNLNAKENSEN